MKRTIVFILTLLATLFSANPSYAATALEQLANSMQLGTFATLNTITGFPQDLLRVDSTNDYITQYADSATWDPIGKRVLFVGQAHGIGSGARFIIYTENDNTWRKGPLPLSCLGEPYSSCIGHAYDHNTVNTLTGDLYYRHYGQPTIYKYSINGAWTTITNALDNIARGVSCCLALEYFPEMNGFVFIGADFGQVGFYNTATNQWTQLAAGLPMNGYHVFIEYNPVHKVMIFGGGNGRRELYKLQANGIVTRQKDAPVGLGITSALVSVDPVSGKYIVIDLSRNVYEYDVITDTWRQLSLTIPPEFAIGDNVIETSITTHGVIMYLVHTGSGSRVYLYKHSVSAPGAFVIPDNTWVIRQTPNFPQSPGAPSKHIRLTYDADRHLVYMWGGDYCVSNPVIGARCASHEEFWSYDIAQDKWTLLLDQLAANQAGYPRGRCLAGMVYDPTRKIVWSINGQQRASLSEYSSILYPGFGLFAFDPIARTWTREGPSPDYGESVNVSLPTSSGEYMSYNPVNDSLFVPSRSNVEFPLSSVILKDGVVNDNWRISPFTAYSPVFGYVSFAVDTRRNQAIIYDPYKGETWSYNFATQQTAKLSTQVLPAKSVYGMEYDSTNDIVIYFGGLNDWEGASTAQYINEFWTFNLATNTWSKPALAGSPPSPRKGEQIIYDPYNNVIMIYGGTGGFQNGIDSYGYDGTEIFLLRLSLGVLNIKGDVNQDTKVDILDVQALVNHILGMQDYGASADVNNDSSVDVLDVQEVVNIILGAG